MRFVFCVLFRGAILDASHSFMQGHDVHATMPPERFTSSMTVRRLARPVSLLIAYGALFTVFDTQATLFEIAPGLSLWYPSAGLNLALVLVGGVAYAPAIFVALLASGLWISEPAIPMQHLLLPDAAIAIGNGVAAWWLRRALRHRTLFTPGAIVRMVGVMAALAAWNGLAGSASYWLTGQAGYALGSLPGHAFNWWIGDWAGMLTLTPPLLLAAVASGIYTRTAEGASLPSVRWPQTPGAWAEALAEGGAIAASLVGAVALFGEPYQLYLCFLPLLWMALRHGLGRAVVGVLLVNGGAIAVLRQAPDPTSILQLQLFIVTLALTGLFIGALVSERRRAMRTLNQSLDALSPGTEPEGADRQGEDDVSITDDVQQFARRLRAKQEQLAEDAGALQHQNQALRSTEAKLKRQNQRKDQLFSIIAHDLRGHIGTAAGLGDLIETDAPTMPRDTTARLAQHLNRSIQQAQDMLDRLLELARVYVNAATQEATPQAADALVGATLEHVAQEAARKNIALDTHISPDLTVHGHAVLVETVVRNLVSNAIKFTERGGHVCVRASRAGDETQFEVRDTGVGMPPEMVEALFDPSHRRSQDGTGGERGTGLGLALSREIVEQHGGRIWAESTPGEGSTFYFTLPTLADASRGDGAVLDAAAVG